LTSHALQLPWPGVHLYSRKGILIRFRDGTGGQSIEIQDDNEVVFSGNVGIGKEFSDYRLDVEGGISLSSE